MLPDDFLKDYSRLKDEVEKLKLFDVPFPGATFTRRLTPLTSTSWDGDAFSTTAKTKIDLNAVFGVPKGVKAVLVRVANRDSASAGTTGLWIILAPNDTANSGIPFRCSGLPDNFYADNTFMIPCDANGDIFYQIAASGAGTMDIIIEIWGWWK